MRQFSLAAAWVAAVLLVGTSLAARADTYAPRQYYGAYAKHPKKNYYYRPYYYKPTPKYVGYKHHYAIYMPSQPKYVYMYNPYSKKYWGRCPVRSGGKAQYSSLAEGDRRGNLEDIDESAFPPPGDLPPIPESTDGARLELPPDDLPGDEKLPGEK